MKKIFRKAVTVLGSVALIGMTVGAASAAAYPAPFTSNTAIVVGANAAPSDNIAAASIASNLDAGATAVTTGTTTGETASLASGSDLFYQMDELNENIQTLTKVDFPTVLADGTFTNDDGTAYDFEQTITIGTSATNHLDFTNSDNDLDDPAMAIEIAQGSLSADGGIYQLVATFNKAVAFNATASEGEDITLFGNTYTVGTATDADTLVLLGGSSGAIINVGESTTITVDGISYDVALLGLSSASTTQASVSVNGDTKTFTQGQTKSVGGVDVYVKTVFRTGDDGAGYAEVQIGSGKLTLETGNPVMTGTDDDDIDGTLVTLTPATSVGVSALTKIQIDVAAVDNDVNHLLPGESFIDPVFGTTLLNFESLVNGPEFTGEKDTGRSTLEIQKGGNRELQVELTDDNGNTATVPFTYQAELKDDAGNVINVIEGNSLSDDEIFFLNSGDNEHMMQITKLNMVAATAANSDVAMKDLISGTTYTFDNHDFTDGYSATIGGQTYTITNDSTSTVTVTSSDYATKRAVFPFIELVSGQDTRMAFTEDTAVAETATLVNTTGIVNATKTLELPTGTIQFRFVNATADDITTSKYSIDGATFTAMEAINDTYTIGSVDYVINTTYTCNTSLVVDLISLEAAQTAGGDSQEHDPAILFVEDDDKSVSTTTKQAILIPMTDTSSYDTVSTPVFTVADTVGYGTESWDDTDFTGWVTNYGTYVWRDTGATNQNFVGLSYGDDMMYAEVTMSEGEAATSSDVGVVTVMDSAVGTVAGKNLVVVGGSAINSVAAELLGAAYREAAFTTATGVGAGEFLIQSFSRAGKTALLVAGYNAADTEKAVTYLLNNDITTTTGTKYKGTSATEASLVVQ